MVYIMLILILVFKLWLAVHERGLGIGHAWGGKDYGVAEAGHPARKGEISGFRI